MLRRSEMTFLWFLADFLSQFCSNLDTIQSWMMFIIWPKQKSKKVVWKKVAVTGFEPGPPDPKSTIYTNTPRGREKSLKKKSSWVLSRNFGNFQNFNCNFWVGQTRPELFDICNRISRAIELIWYIACPCQKMSEKVIQLQSY